MVLFQPPSGPPSPWDLGEYRYAEAFIWVVGIIGLVWGFLLIMDYINKRKRHYLLWGVSFSMFFVVFHQLISTATYTLLLEPLPAAMLAFIPGLLAAGLLMAVYDGKKFGRFFALFVLIMASLIGFFKQDQYGWLTAETALVPTIVVMILHIPSALVLVLIPILTFRKKETRWPALFMSFGGILFGLVGLLLSLATTGVLATDEYLFLVLGLFPIILLIAGLFFALGTLIPEKWNFDIPGIEFEERV